MSLYMRQNRRGMGDVLAASFNPEAMRALVSSQRASMMQAIQQGTSMSDPLAMDPGYGAYEIGPPTQGPGMGWTAAAVLVLATGVAAFGLGYVVYRRMRRGA